MATDHSAHATTDHDTIRDWAEARGGRPAHVPDTNDSDDAGLLRIYFEQGSDDNLEVISWDAFFEKFEDETLAFLYQDETKSGGESRFFKLVDRSTAEVTA